MKKIGKRILSTILAVATLMSCWVWMAPEQSTAAAADAVKDHYLFAYFTDSSQAGQTIHMAVSKDGLNYTSLRNNEPVIIPSKGVGCVRDPYIWFNEQDNHYYIIATELDFTKGKSYDDNGNLLTYSEDGEGFIIWRSRDLVHWYDETMINVVEMSHLIGKTTNMTSVWAPQILWDGEAYVIYFTLRCDQTWNGSYNVLQPYYLRTTNLLDQDAYFEAGQLFNRNLHSIDMDIIQNPDDGKWYLFYKNEDNDLDPSGGKADLKTIHYLVSSGGATGPYSIGFYEYGTRVYPSMNNTNLEGCNSFFDNNGDLITFTDCYDASTGTFYVSKSSDFKTYTMLDSSQYNINTLSPRHGSVVKITEAEYNNLINNAYGVSSSSFPETENLEDHLVARYFTTTDTTYNAANGKNDLTISYGAIQAYSGLNTSGVDCYAMFDSAEGGDCAEIDLNKLLPNSLNYEDGFTVTFSLMTTDDSPNDGRVFGLTSADNQDRSNFAVVGGASGAYYDNVKDNVDKLHLIQDANRNNISYKDGTLHHFIISSSNGNIIVYVDGKLVLKKSRFNYDSISQRPDDDWYEALGNGKLTIGYGYGGTYWYGGLSDFCLYDCSMSYYDIQQIQNEQDIAEQAPLDAPTSYTTFSSAIPSFTHSSTSQMSSLAGTNFANLLYSPQVTGMPSGNDSGSNPSSTASAVAFSDDGVHFGIYYANNTVLFVDGVTTPKMPVLAAGRNGEMNRDGDMLSVYPIVHQLNDTSDCKIFSLVDRWKGWNSSSVYHDTIKNPDSITTGHNSSTSGNCDLQNSKGWTGSQSDRKIAYIANVLQLNVANFSPNSDGYQKVNLSWHFKYNWEKYSSGWKGWQLRNKDLYSSFNTWIIDLRPYVTLRNSIASEFKSIVTNTTYCPGAIAKYKAVVEAIQKFDPKSYNYAGGTEAAVKACADQVAKFKNDYDYVKSLLAPCSYETIPATEPTCTKNGTTAGSHCPVCGEVKVQPQLITRLAHDFGNTTITEGATIQCQNCDYSYTVKENEVKYGNLFNLSKFMFTNSAGVTNGLGRVVIDTDKDTMTFQSYATSGEAMTNASNSTGRDTTHGNYAIPVDGGETYVLEYFLTTKDIDTDVYIFCYDVENNCVANTYGSYYSNSSGKSQLHTYTVTVPESTRYVELRFDVDTAGGTATFANIGFYEKSVYDDYATQNPYSRIRFLTGESKELYTPKKIGYDFLGWYTSDGRKIDNTNQLLVTETVFPRWEQLGHTVNYNGNLFSLTDFAKTNDYRMQGSVQDGHVWADFNKGEFYTLSARETIIDADLTEAANFDTYNTPGTYKVPVTAGQEYVFTMTLASKAAYQCYLWFYNSSGGAVVHPATNSQWISHSTNKPDQGAVASWNGNTLIIRFTVPDGASQMSFRMGTTGQKAYTQTFSEIGLYTAKDYAIYETTKNCPAMDYVSSSQITLANPTRDGYDFMGWTTERFGKGTVFTDASTASLSGATKIYPRWKINDLALTDDSFVLDFGAPIDFNPVANDTKANEEAEFTESTYELVSISSPNAKGTFKINSDKKTVTYEPAIDDVREVEYIATLTAYQLNTMVTGKIYVNPASNALYEENKISVDSNSTGVAWTGGNSSETGNQSLSGGENEVYGYDELYVGNTSVTHSNGSAYSATVNSSNRTSQKLTFTFTGTGFELYGACGNNTGVQVIAVRDSSGNLVKSAVVDTYYNDSYGMLYQTPIYNVSGLEYGTYTVEVTAAYLSMAGALKAQSAEVFGTLSTNDNELADALADVGLDYILEADDVDVEWFDDESILNGGTGANDPTAFGTQSVTSLVNYVDAVRVFEPLAEADENTHYIDSEQNARYYNINDNLMSKSGFIAGGTGIVYIEGGSLGLDAADYNAKGSKHEIYLANGNNQAITFKVDGYNADSRVMLSLRAASGTPIVKVGTSGQITVNSKTEMYYDITEYVAADGTVTVQNTTAGSLLAVGYVKLTGKTVLESTSDLSSAIDMIETPLDGEEITTGAITNVEYTPSTDSHNTFNVTVNGRPTMIQFIEEDGGTRTYDRNNKNVTIKSYNADGVEVNSLDRTVAYEVWTINTNLTGPEVKARAKFITDGAYKWEKNPYSFTYEFLEPELDADLRSITPAAESGKKGAVEVKVVTGPDAQGVRFVMPDGSICTYSATKAVTLENGDLEFTGKAWMNEDGLNTISVYIRENNVWNSVGTIEYTAE